MVGSVFQINPYPCAENRFYLSFTANVSLVSGIRLTATGLCGVLTSDDDAIDINEETSNSRLQSSGSWAQAACALEVEIANTVDADETVSFWVQLRNPAENDGTAVSDRLLRDGVDVHLTASAICVNSYLLVNDPDSLDLSTNSSIPASGLSAFESVSGAQIGDAVPLVILRPSWITHDIGQSSPYPACENEITVTLAMSTPINPDCPVPLKIQISNLVDFSRTLYDSNGAFLLSKSIVTPMTSPSPQTGNLTLNARKCKVCDSADDHMVRALSLDTCCANRYDS